MMKQQQQQKQHIAIFTTASLPWLTGTAVNPLFRAAYLAKDGQRRITLVIPWLTLNHQLLVYPNNITFPSPSHQEAYVRRWLEERVSFPLGFEIRFYPGKVMTLPFTLSQTRIFVARFRYSLYSLSQYYLEIDFSPALLNHHVIANPHFSVFYMLSHS